MKKQLAIILLASACLWACNQKPQESKKLTGTLADSVYAPRFKFTEITTDFGKIKEGVIVEHQYKFTNVGESPLSITTVQAQCGCTVPRWPQSPIMPGEDGVIQVKFDSKGKAGVQKKWITILSNTFSGQDYLSFTAEVSKADSTQ
jgi:Protein of unknown function (DUF1573)